MRIGAYIAVGLLLTAALVTVWSAVRTDSTIGDRAVSLDMLTAVISSGLFVGSILDDDGLLLDLALVFGLLGFLTSITVARFVERRGT